jgi:hypothetical protein
MPRSGRLLTFGLLCLALLAAAANIYYQRSTTGRAQQLWGDEASLLIARAPNIEWILLGDEATQPTPVDVSHAKGIQNLRHALRQDSSYEWNGAEAIEAFQPGYALSFYDKSSGATFHFDLKNGLIGASDRKATGRLTPKIAAALERFFADLQRDETSAKGVGAEPNEDSP